MKLTLCLCLVVPLVVLGNTVPAESESQLQPFNFFGGSSDVSEGTIKCINDAMKEIEKNNPDLVWWFNKIREMDVIIKAKYEKCSAISDETEKWECYLELEKFASVEREKLINSLPKDKKHVLETLKEAISKCLE